MSNEKLQPYETKMQKSLDALERRIYNDSCRSCQSTYLVN